MSNPTAWISQSFAVKGNAFTISGVPIKDIIAEIPPPFYVYDAATIRRQYGQLNTILAPQRINIYYSLKPNSALAVVDQLCRLGSGLEVASLGEIEIAKRLKADPKKISFAGPVKTEIEIFEAITYGVDKINAESEEELRRISAIAGTLGKVQRIGIRVNPPHRVTAQHQHMSGGPQKFGIDLEVLTPDFLRTVRSLPHISLEGIHVYAANQIVDRTAFLDNLRSICEIAGQLNRFFPVRFVDFGGGLGVPYSPENQRFSLDGLMEAIGQTLADFPFLKKKEVELFIEPGRFLVAQAGIYIAQADHIKTSRGHQYVMLDGGWHHFLRPSPDMCFGQHPVYNLSRPEEPSTESYEVAGSLCTPIDRFGLDVPLPVTRAGDLLGVFLAGAYGRGQSPLEFLSHPTPAEVLIDDHRFHLIRPSRQPDKFLKDQIIPAESSR